MQEFIAALVLTLLRHLVPESDHDWKQSRELTTKTYVEVAEAIAQVVVEDELLPGLDIVRTAYVLASVAAHESYLRAEIVSCKRLGMGDAAGAFQIEGRKHRDAACAPLSGARLALKMLRESWAVCAHLPPLERAAFYTGGMGYESAQAKRESRRRLKPALD
jgi:hypothetical protein